MLLKSASFNLQRVSHLGLENTEDLVSGEAADLSDSVRIPEDDSNLRWAKTLENDSLDCS